MSNTKTFGDFRIKVKISTLRHRNISDLDIDSLAKKFNKLLDSVEDFAKAWNESHRRPFDELSVSTN